MRFTIDTNVLVYAFEDEEPPKRRTAANILFAGVEADLVLTGQVLAEFLNVVRRKRPAALPMAIDVAERWSGLYAFQPTDAEIIIEAARFSGRHKMQYWDSIIWQAAARAGARVLLTEDLQDGLSIDGMQALNPFNDANRERLAELLLPDP